MKHNWNVSTSKPLVAGLVVAVAVAMTSGCAVTDFTQPREPVDTTYQGASLGPDLGSVALRTAQVAPQPRQKRGS